MSIHTPFGDQVRPAPGSSRGKLSLNALIFIVKALNSAWKNFFTDGSKLVLIHLFYTKNMDKYTAK